MTTTTVEQGNFSRINARVLLLFAKIKKRRKDLADKEKQMGEQIKSIIELDKSTTMKEDPNGTNGTVYTFTCAPSDSPFAAVMTRYEKKDTVDWKGECKRLYKLQYPDNWKDRFEKFSADVDTSTVDSLDIDVNPNYRIRK